VGYAELGHAIGAEESANTTPRALGTSATTVTASPSLHRPKRPGTSARPRSAHRTPIVEAPASHSESAIPGAGPPASVTLRRRQNAQRGPERSARTLWRRAAMTRSGASAYLSFGSPSGIAHNRRRSPRSGAANFVATLGAGATSSDPSLRPPTPGLGHYSRDSLELTAHRGQRRGHRGRARRHGRCLYRARLDRLLITAEVGDHRKAGVLDHRKSPGAGQGAGGGGGALQM
jgi:hypothetical protein